MPDTSAIRAKTRRVKDIILNQFLDLADKKTPLSESEQALYHELMMTFARNVVPRTQEITGEDGEALQVTLVKYAQPLEEPQTKMDTGIREAMDEGVQTAQPS